VIDKIRRLVAGETGKGFEGIWAHVETIDPIAVGDFKFWDIWGWDNAPEFPYDGDAGYEPYSSFPPPGGVRIQAFQFPPHYPGEAGGSSQHVDYSAISQLRRAFTEAVPHGRAYGAEKGMHRTDSFDFGIVISGELTSKLEGGGEQTLRPGDVYIQNGAMHLWRNDADQPAVLVVISLPARRKRAGESTPELGPDRTGQDGSAQQASQGTRQQ
jgi:mannose-6-phosphate isomerase-like protein (cupin superfamily)